MAPAAAPLALVHEGGHGDLPPLVHRADEVRFRDGHVHEEDLVEVLVAVHEHERANADARRLHVDEEIADPAVPGRRRVGPHQEVDPVRELRARGPHLLAVDDEVVAPIHRAGPQTCQVRAGPGLGEALAPDILGGEDAGQEAPLLLLPPPLDEGRAGHADARVARQDGGPGAEALLVVDDLLHEGGPAASVFLGPRDAHPAGLEHGPLPPYPALEGRAVRGDALVGGIVDAEITRQVGGEPAPQLLPERFLLRGVVKVHEGLLSPERATGQSWRGA